MATAVLRSEDCLKGRYHLDAFGSRPPPSTPKPQRKKSHHRSSPPKSGRPQPPAVPSRSPSPNAAAPRPNRRSPPPPIPGKAIGAGPKKGPVMETVKIMKRGEDLPVVATDLAVDGGDSSICTAKKLGFVDLGNVYAGPAFFSSPSPSALPMPGFLARNEEDEATRALRCVLRLGLP